MALFKKKKDPKNFPRPVVFGGGTSNVDLLTKGGRAKVKFGIQASEVPIPIRMASPVSELAPVTITAAASNLRVSTYRDALLVSLQRQPWQYRALDFYEDEGHAHYASSYIGNAMARIRLIAAKKPKDPKEDPVEVTSGPVYDAVQRLGSGRGGQRGMMRLLGIHLFLVGECWLVGTTMPNGNPRWEVLSIQELLVLPGDPLNLYRKKLPGASPESIPKDALVMRIWREHPRYSELADSGFRPLLDLLEKILLLNRAEKAAARSRSASMGLLAIPQELIPPPQQNQESVADPTAANPFFRQFTEAMMAPLSDEGHPGSVVPILLIGPGDICSKIKFEPMNRPFETGIRQSIEDAITQVAHGLDIPPEILVGLGKTSHFSAWQIKEDTFQAHIQPLIEVICDSLTIAYLKPAIERERAALIADGISEDDIDDYIIWYDERQLVIRPDKGDKAIALHERFAISNEALRRETGFLEADAPDELEYAKRVGIKLLQPEMAITGKPPMGQVPLMQKQADIQTEQVGKQMAMQQAMAPPTPEAQPGTGGGGSGNPPVAPKTGAAVSPSGKLGRPTETVQPDGFHTPQGARAKPRPQASQRRVAPGTDSASPPAPSAPSLTASAERRLAVSSTFSHKLGMIDAEMLKRLQVLANHAVTHAIEDYKASDRAKALTAGASSRDLISNQDWWAQNRAAVEAGLYTAYETTFATLNEELISQGFPPYDPMIMATTIGDAIDASLRNYSDVLYNLINERLFTDANFDSSASSNLIQPGVIREVLQVAGGGGVSADISGYDGGVSTGLILQDVLRQNGVPLEGWLWLYSPEIFRETFMGHRQLDGLVFPRWDDNELSVMPQDAWLRAEFYFPGDHTGCACVAVPWTGADWSGGHTVELGE